MQLVTVMVEVVNFVETQVEVELL